MPLESSIVAHKRSLLNIKPFNKTATTNDHEKALNINTTLTKKCSYEDSTMPLLDPPEIGTNSTILRYHLEMKEKRLLTAK